MLYQREYKDKKLAEYARAGNEAKYGSAQATEFDTDEGGRDSNLAKSGSVGPIEMSLRTLTG
jgi:hypothetical protein